MVKGTFYGILVFISLYLMSMTSCIHDPVFMTDDPMPMDTMIVDTMVVDTMNQDTLDCDTSIINFSQEILPLLKSNCALSGCHNQASHEGDIILESFQSLIASDVVTAFDLSKSDLFEVLTESDPDKRMPPPPAASLTAKQIDIIATWILEGATNEICNDTMSVSCVTTNMTYANNVLPVIDASCRSCHSGATPAGGIDLSTHGGVQVVALNGKLLGAIDHRSGFSAMPQGSTKLDACVINQIQAWIIDGALNN